jgi:ABC-type transport system involved in multi-copper enzyme maturation permease subunit
LNDGRRDKMFTLIKREIEDAIVFFLITAIFIAMQVSVLVYAIGTGWESNKMIGVPSIMYGSIGSLPFNFLFIVAAALGAWQMKVDRNKRISGFLVTRATTRREILGAKMITGFLWILLVVLPIVVTDAVLLKVFPKAALPDSGVVIKMFATVILCILTCYSFGMLIGWRVEKLLPALGVLFVTPILVSLIAVKGFGLQAGVILSLFTAAAIVRMWHKFMTTAL